MAEQWKIVKESKGQYAVSDKGRVKNARTGRILKPVISTWGYECVYLNGWCQRYVAVHRLVAENFLLVEGRIYHKNGNKLDNRLENLECK